MQRDKAMNGGKARSNHGNWYRASAGLVVVKRLLPSGLGSGDLGTRAAAVLPENCLQSLHVDGKDEGRFDMCLLRMRPGQRQAEKTEHAAENIQFLPTGLLCPRPLLRARARVTRRLRQMKSSRAH